LNYWTSNPQKHLPQQYKEHLNNQQLLKKKKKNSPMPPAARGKAHGALRFARIPPQKLLIISSVVI
jgi:hypothetical protein